MRERQLWLAGVRSWDDVGPDGELVARRFDERLRAGVAQSRERLAAGDVDHFAHSLASTEHWRLLPQVWEKAGYLDIEWAHDVAVVGVMDARGIRSFVRGRDLDGFAGRARDWSALVTFNGTVFDLPILRRAFPSWTPPAVHIDLRHVFQKLRLPGGLKKLEPRFGLFRPPHLAQLKGTDALWLWEAQRRGDPTALRRLVEYNLYDVFHLKPLAELGYNALLKRTGMPAPQLPITDRGALLYDLSRAVAAACG
ncbi:MAG: ribonuclease H-like domain-containing protein [Myxococcales bacterium]